MPKIKRRLPSNNKGKVIVSWAKDQDTFLLKEGPQVSEIFFCKRGTTEFVDNTQWGREIERVARRQTNA